MFRMTPNVVVVAWMVLFTSQSSLRSQEPTVGAQPAKTQRRLVEVNREPVLLVNLTTELVELTPGGVRKLAGGGRHSELRVGSRARQGLSFKGIGLDIETAILEIASSGVRIGLKVVDRGAGEVLKDQPIALGNDQEALVELAASNLGDSRIALRVRTSVVLREPVVDYPVPRVEFGVDKGMLIANFKELLTRSSGKASIDRLDGTDLQFLMFENRRFGRFIVSYRPFHGAVPAGFIEDPRMVFEWGGNVFEWFSLGAPILPGARWTLYVAHGDVVSPELKGDGTSIGSTTGAPQDGGRLHGRW